MSSKEKFLAFFDEKSPKWVGIYKWYVVISTFLLCIGGGIFLCIWYDWELGFDFFTIWLCFAASALIAFVALIPRMLLLQFLNNVQVIREKIENEKEE